MTGPWKRFGNYAGGTVTHLVGRVRDTRKPMHSGNIEWKDVSFESAAEASEYAAALNALGASACTPK